MQEATGRSQVECKDALTANGCDVERAVAPPGGGRPGFTTGRVSNADDF